MTDYNKNFLKNLYKFSRERNNRLFTSDEISKFTGINNSETGKLLEEMENFNFCELNVSGYGFLNVKLNDNGFEKGAELCRPWYKKLRWSYYILAIISYIITFLLGLFSTEIKNWIIGG